MKTIFDTLNWPRFRECPALFLGEQELSTLETWMLGYMDACGDAGMEGPLLTPQGLSIALLRDYIACREGSLSTGGIADILSNAAGGEEETAWKKLFAYLDEFEALCVLGERIIEIDEAMARHAAEKRNIFLRNEEGGLEPYPFLGVVYRKTVLSGGLCRIRAEAPDGTAGILPRNTAILPETEADGELTELYGALRWVSA